MGTVTLAPGINEIRAATERIRGLGRRNRGQVAEA